MAALHRRLYLLLACHVQCDREEVRGGAQRLRGGLRLATGCHDLIFVDFPRLSWSPLDIER